MSDRAETTAGGFWADVAGERALDRYATLVNVVNDGIYQLDDEGRFVAVNDTIVELTGYAREEILGEHASLVLSDDEVGRIQDEIDRRLTADDRRDEPIEFAARTADGEAIPCELELHLLVEDGAFRGSIGVVREIAERKRTRRQLKEERDMFAEGPAIVFRWNPEAESGWPVEYVSENVEDAFGYSPEELESGEVPYADLLFDEEIDRIAREVAEHSDGTTERFSHRPYRVKTKDGDVKWVKDTTKIIRDEDGNITNYLGYLVDITERKEREQELQESRNQLRALIDVLPVAVFVAEADGEIVEWNEAAEEIWGGEVAESKSIAEYAEYEAWWVDTGDPVEPDEWPLARALRGEEVTDPDEIKIKGFDGEYRTVLNHGMPVRGADGEVSRAVVTLVDITERKEYQRKLEASNERLKQFAYAASHDLQEPLRMISSYLRLIEREYATELDETGREYLEFAVDGADRMREMIDALLEYSRVDTRGEPLEATDLDAVLDDVLTDLQVRIDGTDAEIIREPLPTVEGDGNQLRQVFQNLLDNAIEYSGDEPPRVHVSAERRETRNVPERSSAERSSADHSSGRSPREDASAAGNDGREWVVTVRDEGIGIDPDDQDRIFEVFHRLHTHDEHAGTGIGLALCERIVDRHGGEIWVESEPGEGATFSFTVPVTEE